jgi:tRNA-dihydrouridine synthase 3
MCEWMSYTHRYVPVGLLERGVSQHLNLRPMPYDGRDELETLLASDSVADWISITAMFLGKPAPRFSFHPKHGSNSYSKESASALRNLGVATQAEMGREDEDEQNG